MNIYITVPVHSRFCFSSSVFSQCAPTYLVYCVNCAGGPRSYKRGMVSAVQRGPASELLVRGSGDEAP